MNEIVWVRRVLNAPAAEVFAAWTAITERLAGHLAEGEQAKQSNP